MPRSRSWYFNWCQGTPGRLPGNISGLKSHTTTFFSLPEVLETLILGLYGFLRAGPRKKRTPIVIKEDEVRGTDKRFGVSKNIAFKCICGHLKTSPVLKELGLLTHT